MVSKVATEVALVSKVVDSVSRVVMVSRVATEALWAEKAVNKAVMVNRKSRNPYGPSTGFPGQRPNPNYGEMGRGAKGGMGNMGGGQRYQAPYMPTMETSTEPTQTGGGFPIGTGPNISRGTPIGSADDLSNPYYHNSGIAGGIKLSEGEKPITGGGFPIGNNFLEKLSQQQQQPMDENTRRRLETSKRFEYGGQSPSGYPVTPNMGGGAKGGIQGPPPHLDPNLGARQREMQRNNQLLHIILIMLIMMIKLLIEGAVKGFTTEIPDNC
jgi:hypothetical protein